MAIPKKLRLTKKNDFDALFSESNVVYLQFAKVFISKKENNVKNPRFAIIVSKTVDKRASQRNYIRRLIASSILKKVTTITPLPYDYIVIVKKQQSKDNVLNSDLVDKEIAKLFS